ncbi:protein MIS12 homolog [Rutidosis leptorrhynchoides]|uniref:protein MIS12 homolog n=1 Tax=Rutidosis leptorrhynchoides TaxID=125765 RepID=UPI003A99E6E2
MDGTESEAIFDSLNLNPQLFINAALNTVDDVIDGAFDHLHKEALSQLKIDGSDKSEDLTKGLDYVRKLIQSALDKRLSMWEKYCLHGIFTVPDGFSLPKDDEGSGDVMDVDGVVNSDLDAQLDSLRTKVSMAQQESAELKREIKVLEKQLVINNRQAVSNNELMKLTEQILEADALKELQKLATELHTKSEKLKTERGQEIQRARMERMRLLDGDMLKMIGENVLSNAKPEEIERFFVAACLNTR